MRLIDADVLHDELMKLEDFTRKEIFKHERSGAEYWMRMGELNQITKLKHLVFDAPTVEAKPEWIPCSKRLPDEEEAYSYNEEEDTYEPNEFIVMLKDAELPTVSFFDGEDFTGGYHNEIFNEVVAWMPLPEPYNADMRKKVE